MIMGALYYTSNKTHNDKYEQMSSSGKHSVRFDVKESLLRWALERSNKSVDELSRKQNLRNLGDWLVGTRKPTRPQLEAFARATYTPFGYLLLSEPPYEQPSAIPHFRTMKNTRSPKRSIDLEDMIKIIERRQDWVRDYLLELGADPLEFIKSSNIDDDPIDVANKIREKLGLAPNWTTEQSGWESAQRYLKKQIEAVRIFVSTSSMVQHNPHRPLDPEEFRGFVLVDDYAPFVFVNSADIGGAQMFTLAHELAHVWIGKSASFDLRRLTSNQDDRLEFACNRIAAEFLVPTKELLQYWDSYAASSMDDPYKKIARRFNVSRIVAARRALDTQCIPQNEFDEFYNDYIQQAQKKKLKDLQDNQSGPSFYVAALPRIGRRFMQTVSTAVGERKLLYREAYSLTGLSSEAFDEMKKIEGVKH